MITLTLILRKHLDKVIFESISKDSHIYQECEARLEIKQTVVRFFTTKT